MIRVSQPVAELKVSRSGVCSRTSHNRIHTGRRGTVLTECLHEAVGARDEPEDGVDKIDPDGALLSQSAAPLIRVVIVPVEENGSKDAKDDNPQQEQRQVPREQARGLEAVRDGPKRRGNGEGDGGDARQPGDDEAKDPLGRDVHVVLLGFVALLLNAVAVQPDDDEPEHELQAADDPAGDVLPCLERGGGGLAPVGDAVVGAALGVGAGVEPVLHEGVLVLEEDGEELCDGHDYVLVLCCVVLC